MSKPQKYKPFNMLLYIDHIGKEVRLTQHTFDAASMAHLSDVVISDNINQIRERALTYQMRNPSYIFIDDLISLQQSQLNQK